MAIVGDA